MFTVSFYIDPRSHTKKGYPVKLQVFFTKPKTNRRKSIGLYLPRKNSKLTPEMNARLVEYQQRAEYANEQNLDFESGYKIILKGVPETNVLDKEQEIWQLKRRLRELEGQAPQLVVPFILNLIEERERSGMATSHFQDLIRELKNWCPDLDFNEINYAKLKDYEAFKWTKTKGRGAIIRTTIRTLRTVFNEARRRGLVYNKTADPFDGFRVNLKPKKKKPSISPEQLQNFFTYEPSGSTTKKNKANIQRVLSLFAFQILIGGHDLADVAALRWSDIVDGRLHFRRFKLRNQGEGLEVNNKIFEEAQAIIDAYGTPEDERIFSFLSHPSSGRYAQQRKLFYRTLKRVCESLELPNIGSKYARTIFRSAGGALGVNDLLLMQIQAHKPSGVTFNYQTDLRLEEQDRVHREVVDFLFSSYNDGRSIDAELEKAFERFEAIQLSSSMQEFHELVEAGKIKPPKLTPEIIALMDEAVESSKPLTEMANELNQNKKPRQN